MPALSPTAALDLWTRYFWRIAGRGIDGAYAVVRVGDNWYAAQPPLRETFHVFTDSDTVLRCDHRLRLGSWKALQLHYRLNPSGGHQVVDLVDRR